MHRPFLSVAVLLILFTGVAHAGPPTCEYKSSEFAKAYYIEDGSVVVMPYDHGFHYRHGVETPEGVRFRPGETFVQYSPDRRVERDYWLVRVNWFNNRAVFHEQVYRYKFMKDSRGRMHHVRTRLVATNDFCLTHFRGLVAFDHAYSNIEYHPGTGFWRSEQFPH